jgi:hypothetical protein
VIDNLTWYLAAGQAAHPIADWAIDQVLAYGPGVALTAVIYTAWRIVARLRDRAAYCRQIRHDIEQARRLAHDIKQAPHIPTQPGTDDDLLTDCWNAWKAQPREEKP